MWKRTPLAVCVAPVMRSADGRYHVAEAMLELGDEHGSVQVAGLCERAARVAGSARLVPEGPRESGEISLHRAPEAAVRHDDASGGERLERDVQRVGAPRVAEHA